MQWTWARYGQSKLANVLFTRELASRYPSITSVAVHPGVIKTDLYDPVEKPMRLSDSALRWMADDKHCGFGGIKPAVSCSEEA